MDTFKVFKIFLRVAENGSFIKAAQTLNLPASTVSTAINKLETRLGVRLLHRTTRNVSLTNYGQEFLERCRSIVSSVEEVENLFNQSTADIFGRIKIDLPSRVATHIVVPSLPIFFNLFPRIQIELGITDKNINLVEEGVECAVRVGRTFDSSYVAKCIGYLEVINTASVNYIAKYGEPICPNDLSKHFAVGYTASNTSRQARWECVYNDEYITRELDYMLTVNNAEAYISACSKGLGIIQIPKYDVYNLIEAGNLVEILHNFKPEPLPVNIIYPHRSNLTIAVRSFTDWVIPLLQKEMDLKLSK
ncbi:TPA: LysR family transcriptional regulator [Klebsiella pneumoniae]|nr:LysR family transcriptional regulator [Klebsiella pneumoniae]